MLELLEALCSAAPSWAPDDHLERDDVGPLPRVNVSIKPTALATHYEPLSRAEGLESAKERIRPILRLARDRGAHVHFDMEHYDAKDLTLSLFRELLSEDEFADVAAGIVDPGLPARRPRRPRRSHRLVERPSHARSRCGS